MKVSNTSERLRLFLQMSGLRQVEFLNRLDPYCRMHGVKFGKSHLSLYLSGKAEPKQDKLSIIGMAFNVNEAWLMGYDVPMEATPTTFQKSGHVGKFIVKEKKSDKSIKIVTKIDSELYRNLCILAEQDERSFEEELEYLLYWAVDNEIDSRST